MKPGPSNEHRSRELGTAPLGRLLLKLSLPGAMGMLIMSLYNVVDTFWVSRLPDGAYAIGALTVCFPLQTIRGAIAMGAHVGVASLVSRRLGEGRIDEADRACGHAVVLPFVLGIAFALVVCTWPDALLRAFGGRPEFAAAAHDYLTVIALGSPFLLFMIIVDGAYRGTGNLVMPMIVMATSALVNLVLDPFFIFGWAGFPAWGVKGAAVATVLAQFCGMCASVIYLLSGRSGFRLKLPDLRLRRDIVAELARVGAPASMMQFVQSAVVSLFNIILGRHSPEAIAAYGLTFRILMMLMPIMGGVSFGLMPIVGYGFGAKDYRRMWRAAALATLVTAVLGGLCSVVVWFTAPQLVGLFTTGGELYTLAILSLRMAVLALVLAAPQWVVVSTLQGMGYGTRAMFVSLARQGLFLVPALLWLSHRYGLPGAFAAMPVSDTLGFVAAVVLLRQVLVKHPHTEGPREEPVPLVEEAFATE